VSSGEAFGAWRGGVAANVAGTSWRLRAIGPAVACLENEWLMVRPTIEDNRCMPLSFGVRLLGVDANAALVQRLKKRYSHPKTANPGYSPEGRGDLPLGARPELVNWLWGRIHSRIPESRRWVVFETATLVHPDSEIVFAFAEGDFYAIRLPAHSRQIAESHGAERMASLGEDWVIGMGPGDAEEWWQSAFEYSAT